MSEHCGYPHEQGETCKYCASMNKPSPSPVEPASDDERLFTRIIIRQYDSAEEYNTVDEFTIGAWATRRQFEAFKEFFLESLRQEAVE